MPGLSSIGCVSPGSAGDASLLGIVVEFAARALFSASAIFDKTIGHPAVFDKGCDRAGVFDQNSAITLIVRTGE